MGPHEPYWQTNTSFSPPHSRGWDHRFQSEGLPYGSHNGIQLYGSSISSNSKESMGWVRGDHFPTHQNSASDGAGSYFSSPSDSFQIHQWTPPPMQGVSLDNCEIVEMREPASGQLAFTQGTSAIPYSGGSTSSCSDGSEYEPVGRTYTSSHRNFSSRCSFMSKPIHPLSFPTEISDREACGAATIGNSLNQLATNENSSSLHCDPKFIRSPAKLQSASAFSEFGGTTQRDALRWSSASSSIDFTDVSEQLDSESIGPSYNLSESFRCGLCERFLSQRSLWSSRRIVRTGDMPIAGVLSCHHVFHAECLEQTTPKTHNQDPPCPLCARSEEENSPEQRAFSRLRNGRPRLRPFCEDGPSMPWGCGQVGDCIEGALHAPPRNTTLLLNRSRIKKHLSLKGNSSKELSNNLKKNGPYPSQLLNGVSVDRGAVGCSRTTSGPIMKR